MEKYKFKVSTRANKKYDVYDEKGKYITSFGDKRYQQYEDKLGHYKHLNHKDTKRKLNYYKRFGENAKEGTAKYFSHKYLW